jgi:hypothetical protein
METELILVEEEENDEEEEEHEGEEQWEQWEQWEQAGWTSDEEEEQAEEQGARSKSDEEGGEQATPCAEMASALQRYAAQMDSIRSTTLMMADLFRKIDSLRSVGYSGLCGATKHFSPYWTRAKRLTLTNGCLTSLERLTAALSKLPVERLREVTHVTVSGVHAEGAMHAYGYLQTPGSLHMLTPALQDHLISHFVRMTCDLLQIGGGRVPDKDMEIQHSYEVRSEVQVSVHLSCLNSLMDPGMISASAALLLGCKIGCWRVYTAFCYVCLLCMLKSSKRLSKACQRRLLHTLCRCSGLRPHMAGLLQPRCCPVSWCRAP